MNDKNIVMMCPTLDRATYEWKRFLLERLNEGIVKKASRSTLSIELFNGRIIYFKGRTEGPNALRGLHADVITLDDWSDEFTRMESEE